MQELHSPNQVLEEGLAPLEAELEAEASQREALQAMAKEMDPHVSQSSRSRMLLALLALFGGLHRLLCAEQTWEYIGAQHHLAHVYRGDRHWPPTVSASRKDLCQRLQQALYHDLCLDRVRLAHPSLSWGMRGTPLPHILIDDLLLIAAIVATDGINLHGALIDLALFQILVVFLMHFYPAAALPLILGAVFATILAVLYLVRQGKG